MKILYLTHNMKAVGGSYMRAFSLARGVARLGHSVTLIASRSDPGLSSRVVTQDRVRIVEPPDFFPARFRHGGLSPIDVSYRAMFVVGDRFDVVHAFDHRPAVLVPALLAHFLRSTSFVSDWADLWGRQGIASLRPGWARWFPGVIDELFENNLRRFADGVTFTSKMLQDRAIAQGVDPLLTEHLPPGANVDLIRPMDKHEMRKKYSLPLDARIAAYIGFAPYDAGFLSAAITAILERQADTLVLICGAKPGGIEINPKASRYDDRLKYFGFLPYEQLGEILACADVLLLPYTKSDVNLGRFPNKFGDYLASGRPVLTQPTGELGELVKLHNVGVLAGASPDTFADAFLALAADKRRLEVLGENGRKLAENELSWGSLAERVLNLYGRVSGG